MGRRGGQFLTAHNDWFSLATRVKSINFYRIMRTIYRFNTICGLSYTFQKAFTLLESLVVIAITVILASLLLTAITIAKQRGKSIVCLNNYKQLLLSWHLYSVDNGDKLAPNSSSGPTIIGSSEFSAAWVAGYLNYNDNNPDNTNTLLLTGTHHGSIGIYNKDASIYRCPEDKSYIAPDVQKTSKIGRVRSCSMNAFVGNSPENFVEGSNFKIFKKNTDFTRASPSGIWLLIDEHEDSIHGGVFWTPCGTSIAATSWESIPSSRHNNGGNLAFCDGSVITKKWCDNRTLIKTLRHEQKSIPTPNNPDVIWLQSRTSVLKD